MVFKVDWKSGATSYLSGDNWQDAMRQACIQNEKGWIKKVTRDRSREVVGMTEEIAALRAENAELKHALEIIRSHGRG